MSSSSGQDGLAARFSASAGTYDLHAGVQAAIAEKVLSRLASVPIPGRLLDAGCGTGLLITHLLPMFPSADIVGLDSSPGMIDRARGKFSGEDRVTWRVADAGTYVSQTPFGLIVSSSALHWISPLESGIRNLISLLAPGGHFVCAVMLEGTLEELHHARRTVAPKKSPSGQLPTLGAVRACLEEEGMGQVQCRAETYTSRHASARDFLRSIHEQGLTGGPVSRGARPLNRTELRALKTEYEARFRGEDGQVVATYKAGFFSAAKPGGRML